MRYNLPELARSKRRRRSGVALRKIDAPVSFRMEMSAALRQVVAVWAREAPSLHAAYSRSVVADSVDDDLVAIMERAEANSRRVTLQVLATLPLWIDAANRKHVEKWIGAVQVALGLNVRSLVDRHNRGLAVDAVMEWSTSLIRDFTSSMRSRVERLVRQAQFEGRSSRLVGRDLARELGIARRRADFIAADQANKLGAALDQMRSEEAGVEEYRWRHSGKVNFRENHKSREGKIYRWDKPPKDGHPRTQPRCGCVAQPYISLIDELELA